MNWPWLRLGVTIEMRGQGVPSARKAGSCGVSTVHGQPGLPGGGGGRSASVGSAWRA